MKKITEIYKISIWIELLLLAVLLIIASYYIFKTIDDYIDNTIFFFVIATPLIIGYVVLWRIRNNMVVTDTLIYLGHIFNVIKFLVLLLLVWAQVFFFVETIKKIPLLSDRSIIYYSLYLSCIIFDILSIFSFIAYFKIARIQNQNMKNILQQIGKKSN